MSKHIVKRMRWVVHCESQGIGGALFCAAIFAERLLPKHNVTLAHHQRDLSMDLLRKLSGCALEGLQLRFIGDCSRHPALARSPWEFWSHEVRRGEALSRGADAFITFVHQVPPVCQAPNGILVVLFPWEPYLSQWPFRAVSGGGVLARLWALMYRLTWKRLIASYTHRFAISAYSARWAQERWGGQYGVLYPAVSLLTPSYPRVNRVVSVARFAASGVNKRQLEMSAAFCGASQALPGWRLELAGALSPVPEDNAYYERVQRACGTSVTVTPNPSRSYLSDLLGKSSIFWHAAGLDEDTDAEPELAEHFGMVTVEAMSGGCVPVVIAAGGQTEIIEHGVSGYLCASVDEMVARTVELDRSPALLSAMSAAAVTRAQRFGVAAMIDTLRATGLPA